MASANDLLKVARGELEYVEGPGNRTKYGKWYGLDGEPWCAMFVSWCANKAGISTKVILKHAYTPAGAQWFKDRKQWHTSKPKPGDIAYYNIGGLGRISHNGIVEKVYSDGSFDAIEGNTDVRGGRTGGKVMRKRRKNLGSGGGFGRPDYEPGGSGPGPQPPKFPLSKGQYFGPRGVTQHNGLRTWQQRMRDRGWSGIGTPDGIYGPKTQKVARQFQQEKGLTVDGLIGINTWDAAWTAAVT